jgi:membrane associated rhomboid family serine protease
MAGRAILIGLLTNILIGFPLSRWFDHSLAVIGLVVGAIVFSAMSSKSVLKVLKSLDYYLYASS